MQAIEKRTSDSRRRSRGKASDGKPNKIDIYIGGRIRLKRQSFGWSQEKMGKMLGLTFQQVQKYETGLNRVSGSRMYDIACLLGVDANFFYQDMPEEIRRESPRYIAFGYAAPTAGEGKIAGAGNPAASERALKLLNAFLKIPNQEVADKLFDLMMAFNKSSYMAKKQQQEDIDSRKQ